MQGTPGAVDATHLPIEEAPEQFAALRLRRIRRSTGRLLCRRRTRARLRVRRLGPRRTRSLRLLLLLGRDVGHLLLRPGRARAWLAVRALLRVRATLGISLGCLRIALEGWALLRRSSPIWHLGSLPRLLTWEARWGGPAWLLLGILLLVLRRRAARSPELRKTWNGRFKFGESSTSVHSGINRDPHMVSL